MLTDYSLLLEAISKAETKVNEKLKELQAAKATVRIEIPAGLTNEEVKDILDKAYTAYITAQ